MSESVHEMPPKEIMDRLIEALMKGWGRESLGSPYITWVFARMPISDLKGFADKTLNLADCVTDEELKELVRKYMLPKLEKYK